MALLSGAPFDDPTWWLLGNDQIVAARDMINDFAGTTRMLGHSVITPKPVSYTHLTLPTTPYV